MKVVKTKKFKNKNGVNDKNKLIEGYVDENDNKNGKEKLVEGHLDKNDGSQDKNFKNKKWGE